MQSGFPTASLPRGVETASTADRPSSAGRESGAGRRDDATDTAHDSAFSDMVAASRNPDETAGRKPAGRSTTGNGEAAADAAQSPGDGKGASGGKSGSGETAAPAANSNDTAASAQGAANGNADGQQGKTSQPAAPSTAQATSPAAASTTAPAGGVQPGSVATGEPAMPADARTAAKSAGTPAPAPATGQNGQAAQGSQSGPNGNADASASAGIKDSTSASGTGSTASDAAPANQAGQAQDKTAPSGSTQSSRTPADVTTAGTGETATTATRSGISLPDAASPTAQAAVSQAGQAAASQAAQARNAQAGNGQPVATDKQASATKSQGQNAKPATGLNTSSAGTPAANAATASSTATAAEPGTPDAPAPLREDQQTRAILESGKSGAGRKTGSVQGQTQAQGETAAGKSGAPAPAVPNTTDTRPDATIQLPRDTAPGSQSPLGQLLANPGPAGDTSQPLQTVETDTAQADAEIQLNRAADARAGVDRAGSNLPRFAPHTAQHLAGQITRQFNNGQRVFDIRLDPAELGKVDVRLELRADNRVHAVLTAERPETLAELQRAARDLERSLNDAGLELAEEGLSFQMSEDGQTPGSDDDRPGTTMPIFADGGESGLTTEAAAPVAQQSRYGFLLTRREGVDMRV